MRILVGVLIALALAGCNNKTSDGSAAAAKPATESPPDPPPAPVLTPAEAAPSYSVHDPFLMGSKLRPDTAKKMSQDAAEAVYARCSRLYAWREGSQIESELIIDEHGKPATIVPTKTASARMCGLEDRGQKYDFDAPWVDDPGDNWH